MIINHNLFAPGADPGFSFGGGGGRKRFCARTHITSARPEVPYGRAQGPRKGPGSSRGGGGGVMLSLVLSEPYF